ncbi:hypothetical protein TWF730_004359 [Orbilia blumenaviensis]|uniref:Uncharacterized protein n=1 Tax=Orbilia blumenaviensis TaxID=1796055 RepID=A0AAV9U1F3_9PEZI
MHRPGLASYALQNPYEHYRILAFTRYCDCFDPRDYVYAILSFQSNYYFSTPPYIQPNYRKTKRQVYLDLLIAFRNKFLTSLNILAFCNEGTGDTPSWVPGWARTPAILCDTIKTKSTLPPPRYSHEESISIIRTWVPQNLETLIYPTGQSSLDSFASLIVHGEISETWLKLPFLPPPQQAKLIMQRDILPNGDPNAIDFHYGEPHWSSRYYSSIKKNITSSGFIETKTGYYTMA